MIFYDFYTVAHGLESQVTISHNSVVSNCLIV